METSQDIQGKKMRQFDPERHVVSNDDKEEAQREYSQSEDELISCSDDNPPKLEPFDVGQSKKTAPIRRSSRTVPSKQPALDSLESLDIELGNLQRDYERTRKDLKIADRENRDQSIQLRDLKRANVQSNERNAQLREQNAQLFERLRGRGEKISKSERNKFFEHVEMLNDHIAHLQLDRKKGEAHMEFLTEQTREANEGKSCTEAEMRKLQRQVKDLSTNLTECKDDLLRLQPTSQVSDNEIAEQFSNLDQQITAWVDDRTEDSEVMENNFDKINSPEDLPELFKGYLGSSHLRMARKYLGSQPSLLRYLIHCHLRAFIFADEIYLFGLDARTIALMQGLEEGMMLLEPRRDTTTICRWRSETLQALLKMPAFVEEQNRQAEFVSRTLQLALDALIVASPSQNKDDSSNWSDIHTQITLPAIHLATKLRLSTSSYILTSHLFSRDPTRQTHVFIYEIKDSHMIDIATDKVIRPDSVLKVADDGRIGEEMLVVSPALLRVQSDRKGKILVCKPTILVKLDEPMQRKARGIKAIGLYAPGWLGGVGGGSEGVD